MLRLGGREKKEKAAASDDDENAYVHMKGTAGERFDLSCWWWWWLVYLVEKVVGVSIQV